MHRRTNFSDLPLFDIIFGTFKNPKEFAAENGYWDGASSRIGSMLLFRDISEPPSSGNAPAQSDETAVTARFGDVPSSFASCVCGATFCNWAAISQRNVPRHASN